MKVDARKVFDGLVKAVGKPETWVNNCYFMACMAVEKCDVDGWAVYGMYTGEVAKGTFFYKEGRPLKFVRHGWVLLKDGRVLDPTRWVFEGKKPYVFVGSAEDYDEGASQLRELTRRPPPDWDPEEAQHYFDGSSEAWTLVEKLLKLQNVLGDDAYKPGNVSVSQCFWLANLPPRDLGPHVWEVYQWLKRKDLQIAVPMDNWRMVERMFAE